VCLFFSSLNTHSSNPSLHLGFFDCLMSVGTDNEVEVVVGERELIQFEQVEVFRCILLSDDFYPGGLERLTTTSIPFKVEKDLERQKLAKGEESLRKLTSIVSDSERDVSHMTTDFFPLTQLDEYQEQSYLLDPHLVSIVLPAVKALQSLVRRISSDGQSLQSLGESADVQRLARLLYYYTKVRGYKTISES
jgi:hypothetical protein